MSGYDWTNGMSNNAVSAYADGEKPLSKWSKKDILEKIQEVYPDIYELAKKQTIATLRKQFLYKSSWHHTSKFYNATDFYKFDEDVYIDDFVDDMNKIEKEKSELKCLQILKKDGSYDVFLNLTDKQLNKLKKEKVRTYATHFCVSMNDWNNHCASSLEAAGVKLNICDFKKGVEQ